MSKNESSQNGGIGFVGLLTIVFITLKLLEKIEWSWWWVWSPIWITILVVMVIIAFAVIVIALTGKKLE